MVDYADYGIKCTYSAAVTERIYVEYWQLSFFNCTLLKASVQVVHFPLIYLVSNTYNGIFNV